MCSGENYWAWYVTWVWSDSCLHSHTQIWLAERRVFLSYVLFLIDLSCYLFCSLLCELTSALSKSSCWTFTALYSAFKAHLCSFRTNLQMYSIIYVLCWHAWHLNIFGHALLLHCGEYWTTLQCRPLIIKFIALKHTHNFIADKNLFCQNVCNSLKHLL